MVEFILNTLALALAAGPWLLGGLLAAGLIRAFVPHRIVARVMGGRGPGGVLKASLIGIPLPLCSCGVLPTAIGLRRQGASKSATVSFLISTPEVGLDSFALSYVLLGPFMAIARPIAAFFSALFTGVLTTLIDVRQEAPAQDGAAGESPKSACCCASKPSDTPAHESPLRSLGQRFGEGMRYVFTKLLDDIAIWLGVALLVAGVMTTVFSTEDLAEYGSGLGAMLVMLLAGVPLYICASASTPVAAGLLAAGVSPGTVLVFLLAGPATNIGSIGVLRKELGNAVTALYLLGIALTSIACGLALDAVAGHWQIDITAQMQHTHEMIPLWISIPSAVVLLLAAIRPLRRRLLGWIGAGKTTTQVKPCCDGGK